MEGGSIILSCGTGQAEKRGKSFLKIGLIHRMGKMVFLYVAGRLATYLHSPA
jgi:hypothetical protein